MFLPPTFVGDVRHSWTAIFRYYNLKQKVVPAAIENGVIIANGVIMALPFSVLAFAIQAPGYSIVRSVVLYEFGDASL
jgi:hypothetical protein